MLYKSSYMNLENIAHYFMTLSSSKLEVFGVFFFFYCFGTCIYIFKLNILEKNMLSKWFDFMSDGPIQFSTITKVQ